jgi:HK97 family phage portal protein
MPSFFTRLFGAAAPAREAKASRAAKLLAMHSIGQPQWTARNSAALTREGYERNAVGHRCVRMVAEAAASVPWLLYEGAGDVPDHPLLALIERPNPTDTCVSFIEAICANLLLYGNAYIESVLLDGQLRELYALRPDRMRVEPGRNGWPAAFVYRAQGEEARYVMQGEGIEPILHIRLFHPLDDYYGFSPLAAAQVALDTHNAASFWNKALLDNSARPSGALVYSGPDGAHLSDEQFTRLKQELEENFSGADNAGRPLLLEGGLDWRALSLSPKDMDFAESKAGAAREIALAFGVPPLLLGLPGDNTFANYSEANRAFWRQTVLPLVTRVQKSFQAWLRPGFGDFRLDYNADRLEALATERASEWDRIGKASFLTLDEQREAVGYGPAPKDGVFAKWGGGFERRYSPSQPRTPAGSAEGGQCTSGGGGGGGVTGSVSLLGDGEQVVLNIDPNVASDLALGTLFVQKSFQAWLRPGFGDFRFDCNAGLLEALAA